MNIAKAVREIPDNRLADKDGNIYALDNGIAYRIDADQAGVDSEEPLVSRKAKKIGASTSNPSVFDGVKSKRKFIQPIGQEVIEHIAGRRGQTKFREALLEKYKKCVVTGCDITDVMEAAHIEPYASGGDPTVQNGLLLRSDIHTLFDLDLLGINPDGFVVELNPACDYEPYCNYRSLRLPLTDVDCNALKERYKLFQKRLL